MAILLKKYAINTDYQQTIQVPGGARFLSVQIQTGNKYLFALVDDTHPDEPVQVVSVVTEDAEATNSLENTQFVRTCQVGAGPNSVTHVFVRTSGIIQSPRPK